MRRRQFDFDGQCTARDGSRADDLCAVAVHVDCAGGGDGDPRHRCDNSDLPLWGGQALASDFVQYNYEMATMTGGNLIFEAHQYFDGSQGWGGGGSYGGTYTSYAIDAQSGVQALQKFTDWLTATGTTGYIGEVNVPNNVTDNNAAWLPLQVNFFNAAKAANVKASMWFYGNNTIQPANL